jgi:hypothetical protein
MTWRAIVGSAIALVVVAVAAGLGATHDHDPSVALSGATSTPLAPLPERLTDVGGVYQEESGFDLDDLDPSELPYPYTRPIPPEQASPLDGAYLRITSLEGRGQPAVALPIRCLRCIPFRVEAGVSTLTLYHGRYFLHHQLSNFRSLGFFEVDGDRVTFFNDPNCPQDRGVYRWVRDGVELSLQAVHDACPFDRLRAQDLTDSPWTAFNHCLSRVTGLWPGELGCSKRRFEP